jgi:hypothetical protein
MAFQVTEMHKQSMSFTLANVFGSFLCVIILLLKQLFSAGPFDVGQVLGKGDVYIICASMSISAIYAFYDYKNTKRDWSVWFFIASIINYAISVVFYMFVLFITSLNAAIVFGTSLLVFVINIFMTYISSYYSNMMTDAVHERAVQGSKLESDLAKALSGGRDA